MKKYEQIDHTADMAARVYGGTVRELFENAAYAMFDMMGGPEGLIPEETCEVSVEGVDRESLLVAWLNELGYRAQTSGTFFFRFEVLVMNEKAVKGVAYGQKVRGKEHLRAEIKAATYHELEIKRTDDGYEATVVFDV
jgi:SHS2 domain-containing protein